MPTKANAWATVRRSLGSSKQTTPKNAGRHWRALPHVDAVHATQTALGDAGLKPIATQCHVSNDGKELVMWFDFAKGVSLGLLNGTSLRRALIYCPAVREEEMRYPCNWFRYKHTCGLKDRPQHGQAAITMCQMVQNIDTTKWASWSALNNGGLKSPSAFVYSLDLAKKRLIPWSRLGPVIEACQRPQTKLGVLRLLGKAAAQGPPLQYPATMWKIYQALLEA